MKKSSLKRLRIKKSKNDIYYNDLGSVMKKESKTNIICPVCKKKTAWHGNKWRPFCSERCKMLDLGAWASEDYTLESLEDEYEDSSKDVSFKSGEYH